MTTPRSNRPSFWQFEGGTSMLRKLWQWYKRCRHWNGYWVAQGGRWCRDCHEWVGP